MSFANLPPPVATFLRALQACDHTELLATLAGTSVVVDRGREYRGDVMTEEVREPLANQRANTSRTAPQRIQQAVAPCVSDRIMTAPRPPGRWRPR
jgi:hypothetical protein